MRSGYLVSTPVALGGRLRVFRALEHPADSNDRLQTTALHRFDAFSRAVDGTAARLLAM